ncbi:MAG: hypothetical protein IPJ67_02175 [Candidatus Moraniibacteriota bacterium]|nr:MAG: hypothetical protein IPJ67_02175 [Candidatus Moranbacteria bacterium]
MKPCFPESDYTLSNDSFESHLNAIGNGYLKARGCFLTSYRPSSDDGLFFFIRDTDSEQRWSATPAPVFTRPEAFRMDISKRSAHIERSDNSIDTALDILVPETGDFELRRLTLTNRSDTVRRLEVTSSVDIILLFDRLRDSLHQTFSNMFIGAEFSREWTALLYHRRFFDDPQHFPFFMHRIFLDRPGEFLGFETDREAFIGRGQPFGRPLALDRPLKNTAGYILDPLANLRAAITLEPGKSSSIFFSNSAHFSPEQPASLANRFPDIDSVQAFFLSEFEQDNVSRKEIPCNSDIVAPVTKIITPPAPLSPFDTNALLFWNGFGGFDPETHDYRMRICPEKLPPQPWANFLANPDFGMMTTENALGTTWFKDSKHGRLTPWNNNPVSDPPAEILFVRQTDSRETWSLTPAPLPASSEYHVTHGRGFTKYEGGRGKLRHTLTASVHPTLALKYLAVEFENREAKPTDFDLIFFMDTPTEAFSETVPRQYSPRFLSEENAFLLDPSTFVPFPDKESIPFFAAITADRPLQLITCSKEQFFGISGSLSAPKNISEIDEKINPKSAADTCIVVQVHFSLGPHEKQCTTIAVCAGTTEQDVRELLLVARKEIEHQQPFSLESVRHYWKRDDTLPTLSTPDDSLNILFNTWLPYQALVSRLWAKMGFYQPGGAFGFRDQLQDALALWYIDPALTKQHILKSAAQQFEDGNVRAWWSPNSGYGVKNATSDHPLWLAWVTAEYIRLSGETDFLNEETCFLSDDHDAETQFDVKRHKPSLVSASLLEHCLKSIEYVSVFGVHGLPLIRGGDWNDGFNRIGNEGEGESVWLGFFLFSVLEMFIAILSARGDSDRVAIYHKRAITLKKNLNTHGWGGHWFLRAFYDDGTPLGAESNHECRIDAIAQSWSVISDAGEHEKSKEAMENLLHFLYDPESKILRLLDPPFNDLSKKNPGYIKDYPPGIRENGSQYNHAVFWAAEAFAKLGNADRVYNLLECANPIHRSDSENAARLYEVEPYVVAADIYSAEHRGKGGWTWYTASAGLMYRTIIEALLGIHFNGNTVSMRPCLPKTWTQCSITIPRASGCYTFTFTARENHANVVRSITQDGVPLDHSQSHHALPTDGQDHRFDLFLE